ncbi:hypothetical protein BOX15_Mlig032987g1 [Macrostomum lignano]|uniref:Aminopeptidase n=1 Tax=Macrostomum lignano TaxID=282301 RepID=A0A267FGA5_9PLAT|nr:hypothetical protein BOX15_Mlig032987g1 [Macrostomum lignano]
MKFNRKCTYTPRPSESVQGTMSIDGNESDVKGVFLSMKRLLGISGVVLLCVIIIPIIVYYAKPGCTAGARQLQVDQATTAALGTQLPPVKDVRLPLTVKPIHYNLILAPFIYSNNASEFYFTGSVNISVAVQSSTTNFKLHSHKLQIQTPRVVDSNGNNVAVASVEEDFARQWQSITMSEPLQAGNNYTIIVDRFRGPLERDLSGIYLSSYKELGIEKYLVASQMQATDARKTFPCFDEPAFKATFAVSIVRHQNFKAASNMPTMSSKHVLASDWFVSASGSERMIKEDFRTTPRMSTYLLAILVSQFDYTYTTDTKNRVYGTWARPDRATSTECAKSIAKNITAFYERYFDIEYPLPKIDQATIPDFSAGAMENWGLIMYREAYLVCNPSIDKSTYLQLTVAIISHELGHMWFGNLVTPDWWDDIWLNEGFASFVEVLAMDQLHPDWDVDAQFVVDDLKRGLQSDGVQSSHPIYVEVNHPDEVNEIFDTITYSKGSSVLRMLYNSVGDSIFRIGVSKYLKQYNYSNTFHTALYQSLTSEARASGRNIDVGEFMDRWIKQMGYPVISCARQSNELSLFQKHFLISSSDAPTYGKTYSSPFDYTWIIPITAATSENISSWNGSQVSHLVHWMREKSQKFSINSTSWYLLNLRSTGFYRVNYDAGNWDALINQLLLNHSVFTPQDRARLIDDSFALAMVGQISYSIPLNMTKYMKNERHYAPWNSVLSSLAYIYSMLHRQSPQYGTFSAYMKSLILPIYNRTGVAQADSDSHLTRITREKIVKAACRYGIKQCAQYAQAEFQRYVSSNFTDKIVPDIRYTVMCRGVAMSDAEVWDNLYDAMLRETSPGVQNDILKALACTREPWLLNRYLLYTLDDGKIRRQDAALVVSSVASNPMGLQIMWDFLRGSWSSIQARQVGIFSLARYASSLGGFNSPERLREIREFLAANSNSLASAVRAFDNALESVRNNVRWMTDCLPAVMDWLNSQS